ncbi:MAG TPA: VanZ family protein, partial [Longimicrobiales bacterium]|nr:VanZ family protein [Longimicrobiales bacterium]
AARRDLFSAVDVVVSFGLYVPLGAVLAVWPLGRGGAARAFLPAVLLSATLELAQAAIEARTLDITDFLVQTAGAAVGWAALRRAGFRPAGYGLPGPPAPVRTARRAE